MAFLRDIFIYYIYRHAYKPVKKRRKSTDPQAAKYLVRITIDN